MDVDYTNSEQKGRVIQWCICHPVFKEMYRLVSSHDYKCFKSSRAVQNSAGQGNKKGGEERDCMGTLE